MLRRDMFRLGLLAGAATMAPVEARPLPKRPPHITLWREKGFPLSIEQFDDNFAAMRALIERLEWQD